LKNLKNQDLNLRPYPILKIKERFYSFITNSDSEYHCYFFLLEGVFSDFPDLTSKVFGFNLELKYKPKDKTGLDKRIAQTVVTVLKTFLDEKINAVVYICDDSDGREKARFHKFTHWFSEYDDGTIVQLKGVIRASKTNILNAMLIHKDNKLLNKFIEAYAILTGIYTKPDEDELKELDDDIW
jgi:hypothetical protein